MSLRMGELFAGYSGLGMSVAQVLDIELAWYSDICKFDKNGHAVGHHDPCRAPCSVMAHHYPGVPNLGDVTAVDWSRVEPVDVLTGGFPCTDVSSAGKRAGLRPGTRSGLWSQMAYAIDQLRPSLVLIENVRGLLNAEAHSDMEPCPWCLGDNPDQHSLRALGAVLGDLASLGYDAQWHGLRAADIGAPHGRFRVFLIAWPAADAYGSILGAFRSGLGTSSTRRRAALHFGRDPGDLLPTPRANDTNGAGAHGDGGLDLRAVGLLLPTPAVNDMGEGKTVERWDEWTAAMRAKHGNGNGHGKSLSIEAQRLLPTPKASSNENRQSEGYGGRNANFYGILRGSDTWGNYAAAIARWEAILGRPAPDPTQTSRKGDPQLAPAFVEWMMGLPDGWVTATPGITRTEALKALGNGVVPQQAAEALRILLPLAEAMAS
jgi:DNA (cytosine-5)-methyltransferase 1